jgi:hypothetical protein
VISAGYYGSAIGRYKENFTYYTFPGKTDNGIFTKPFSIIR